MSKVRLVDSGKPAIVTKPPDSPGYKLEVTESPDPPVRDIAYLSQQWFMEKRAEDEAKKTRILIEEELANLIPGPDESTVHERSDGFEVAITRKYTRSLDEQAYHRCRKSLGTFDPIISKLAIDLKKLRAIESVRPELYKTCARFITVKPAKTSIKIKVVAIEDK